MATRKNSESKDNDSRDQHLDQINSDNHKKRKKRMRNASDMNVKNTINNHRSKKRKINEQHPSTDNDDIDMRQHFNILREYIDAAENKCKKQQVEHNKKNKQLLNDNKRLNDEREKILNENKLLKLKLTEDAIKMKNVLKEKESDSERDKITINALKEKNVSLNKAMRDNEIEFEKKLSLSKKELNRLLKQKDHIVKQMEKVKEAMNCQQNMDRDVNRNVFEPCDDSKISTDMIIESDLNNEENIETIAMEWIKKMEKDERKYKSTEKTLRKKDKVIKDMKRGRDSMFDELRAEIKKLKKECNDKEDTITELRIKNLGYVEDLKIKNVDK